MSKQPDIIGAERELAGAAVDLIIKQCPGEEAATLEAVNRWVQCEPYRGPYDLGVFAVCDEFWRQFQAHGGAGDRDDNP